MSESEESSKNKFRLIIYHGHIYVISIKDDKKSEGEINNKNLQN